MVWAISGAQGMLCLLRQIQFWLHRIGFIARQVVILGLVEEIVQQRRVLCRAVCGGGCGGVRVVGRRVWVSRGTDRGCKGLFKHDILKRARDCGMRRVGAVCGLCCLGVECCVRVDG